MILHVFLYIYSDIYTSRRSLFIHIIMKGCEYIFKWSNMPIFSFLHIYFTTFCFYLYVLLFLWMCYISHCQSLFWYLYSNVLWPFQEPFQISSLIYKISYVLTVKLIAYQLCMVLSNIITPIRLCMVLANIITPLIVFDIELHDCMLFLKASFL